MTSFDVIPTCDRDSKTFQSRSKAEEGKQTHVDLCPSCQEDDVLIDDGVDDMDDGEVEVVDQSEPQTAEAVSDGGDTHPVEENGVVPPTEESPGASPNDSMLPDTGSMDDPLDTLPGWMITQVSYSDRGDTTTTVNKRGCQVIANYLGLDHETEALVPAQETEFEYAYYKTTVRKPNGNTYTGHGTARADGEDQDESDGWKLDMMAETRSYKRAVKAATGGGVEAFAKEREQS